MPEHPIVDTHVHFWDPGEVPVEWLSEIPRLDRRFDPEALTEHAAGVEIDRLVFVEADVAAGQHIAEAQWVSDLAGSDPRIAAIVAHAPLERGAGAEPDLERLARMPLVRGIRRLLQAEPDRLRHPAAQVVSIENVERIIVGRRIGSCRAAGDRRQIVSGNIRKDQCFGAAG